MEHLLYPPDSSFVLHPSSFLIESRAVKKYLPLLLFVLSACGKRGNPHPPVPIIPKATSDLVVAQRGPQVLLSWSFPSLTTAGQNLTKVRRVVVYRAVEELPVAQPPRDAGNLPAGETDPKVPPPIALFSKVPPLTPAQFVKVRTRIDSIESARLPGSTVGAKLTYEDTPPFHTADGRPVRLDYAVVTEGFSASSDLSNIASLVPIDVPVPPPSLTATAKAEGVVLEWTPPATSITAKAKPFVAGYNVYRLSQGETASSFETPVNTSPVSKTTYTDVPPYGTFTYRVTAVSSASPRIESDPSPPATATFKDLLPPPPPTGLTALVEAKAVRLVWEPV